MWLTHNAKHMDNCSPTCTAAGEPDRQPRCWTVHVQHRPEFARGSGSSNSTSLHRLLQKKHIFDPTVAGSQAMRKWLSGECMRAAGVRAAPPAALLTQSHPGSQQPLPPIRPRHTGCLPSAITPHWLDLPGGFCARPLAGIAEHTTATAGVCSAGSDMQAHKQRFASSLAGGHRQQTQLASPDAPDVSGQRKGAACTPTTPALGF